MWIDPTLAATVVAVVEEGTLDAAAARLHLTPSAVSQRVKTLEDRVGQRLVVRTKPVRATEAGQAVLRYARRLALVEHDVTADLGLAEGSTRPRLSVAVNADSLGTWFLEPLAAVAERHSVEIHLHRDDQDRTAGLLESGTVMAAVTSQVTPVTGCRVRALGSLVYEAMAAPSWMARWAPAGLDSEVLRRAPYVDFDRNDGLQADWLAAHAISPQDPPRHLIPSTHDFARAVELGMGWAMLPTQQAEPLVADGTLVPLGGPDISVPLYWQQWTVTSKPLDALTTEIVHRAQRTLRGA
ncbi:LysR family transcriptional regulator ArgP [Spiractinospora alimapuensis]|uniref:LysR family transcriptional regulator ArgP n=1 Tax=Spiractinospora alimapuensis TaxID=2820884 RepID=UPI001F21F6F0|nr:LysR family transcriptional regulator ArgP [Spiractinospora alimapuensis]QVQ54488.1 LysR family transcriptional regulator ArgP [Spiractinospora alimapuensis]